MSKLLKCPFCGAEAELMIFNSEYETVTVRCTNEDCDITMGKAFFTDEEAIEHWNRRIPMANIVEKLEEAEKKGSELIGKPHMDSHVLFGWGCAMKTAIEIVKKEGVKNDRS